MQQNKLYVGNFPYSVDEAQLRGLFATYGDIADVAMIMDRETDAITAAMTSLRAVATNLGAMALWAAMIVGLVIVGFATMMVGMVILLPLLGHATWHAYREMIH